MTDRFARAGAWHADTIAWQERGANGTRYALLEDRRDEPDSAFTYAFFIPAGFWDPAHWHTTDARIVVLKDNLKLGYGAALNRDAATAFAVGSFVLIPGEARHFDGADEDTIIIGTATGQWATTYVDPTHVPSAGTPPLPGGVSNA